MPACVAEKDRERKIDIESEREKDREGKRDKE